MADRRSPAAPLPVHLDVELKGVVLPTWVAVALSVMAALSCGVVLLAVIMFKDAADSLGRTQASIVKEIRILDVHLQDIQNIMIRNGLASREDFAEHMSNKALPEEKK